MLARVASKAYAFVGGLLGLFRGVANELEELGGRGAIRVLRGDMGGGIALVVGHIGQPKRGAGQVVDRGGAVIRIGRD